MAYSGWLKLGLLAVGASVAGGIAASGRHKVNRDSAPARSTRHKHRFGDYIVAGTTVTIKATPERIREMWQSSPELWQAFEYMPHPDGSQSDALVTPAKVRELATRPLNLSIMTDNDGQVIAWRSDGDGHADAHGRMRFRDNGTKGTAVEVIFAFMPHHFRTGLTTDGMIVSIVQTGLLRDLRRMKMLIETGEIATARSQRSAA